MDYSCWTPWLQLGIFILLIVLLVVVWCYLASLNDKAEKQLEYLDSHGHRLKRVDDCLVTAVSAEHPRDSSHSYGYVSRVTDGYSRHSGDCLTQSRVGSHSKSHSESKSDSKDSKDSKDCGFPDCSCGCKDGYDCTCDHSSSDVTASDDKQH